MIFFVSGAWWAEPRFTRRLKPSQLFGARCTEMKKKNPVRQACTFFGFSGARCAAVRKNPGSSPTSGRVGARFQIEVTTPVRPARGHGRTGVVASIWHLAEAVPASCGGGRVSFWSGENPGSLMCRTNRGCLLARSRTGVVSSHEAKERKRKRTKDEKFRTYCPLKDFRSRV